MLAWTRKSLHECQPPPRPAPLLPRALQAGLANRGGLHSRLPQQTGPCEGKELHLAAGPLHSPLSHYCNNTQTARDELRIKCAASTPWLMLHAACRIHQLKPAAGKYTTVDSTAKIRDMSPFGHETCCTVTFRRDEAHYLATVRHTIRLTEKKRPMEM